MTKRHNTRKGKGWFNKKKRSVSRKSNKLSDVNYNREGEYYEHIYTLINNIINNYDRSGKLAKGYTVQNVDHILSKYVDEPKNIDGLDKKMDRTFIR